MGAFVKPNAVLNRTEAEGAVVSSRPP